MPAVLLDTPYGFQANAGDISARAVAYFRESVRRTVEVASLGPHEPAGSVSFESALARVSEARWVFAGPGSPTYALRQWRPTVLPRLLADKLSYGGCIVFSSAAALTLGRWTVPVYEVYKVGADPVWAEGLDLLTPLGMTVAVIPHYDNAEGGSHDTRYCYLGEGRLEIMEAHLPPEGWVLGVDEHTACIFDFEAGTATVMGLGSVTIRRHGRSATVPSGKTLAIDELVQLEPLVVTGSLGGLARAASASLSADAPADRADGPGDETTQARAVPSWRRSAGSVPRLTPPSPSETPRRPPRPPWSWRAPSTRGLQTPSSPTRSTRPGPPSAGWLCAWANWLFRGSATPVKSWPPGLSPSWPSGRRLVAPAGMTTGTGSGNVWRC